MKDATPHTLAFIFIVSLYLCETYVAGKLEEALEMYKRSRQFGVERAALHIRNVRVGLLWLLTRINIFSQVGAKILGQKMKAAAKDSD